MTEELAQEIIADVARAHGFEVDDVKGKRRPRPLVTARHEAARRLHLAGFSTVKIGRFLNRDHSTIVDALQKFRSETSGEAN